MFQYLKNLFTKTITPESQSESTPVTHNEYVCIGYVKTLSGYIAKLGIPHDSINNLNRKNIVDENFAEYDTNCAFVIDIEDPYTHEKKTKDESIYETHPYTVYYVVGEYAKVVLKEANKKGDAGGAHESGAHEYGTQARNPNFICFHKTYERAIMEDSELPLEGPFIFKRWHRNGRLMHEANYLNRNLHGTSKVWDNDGKLLCNDMFDSGKYVNKDIYVKTTPKEITPNENTPDGSNTIIGYMSDFRSHYIIKISIPEDAVVESLDNVVDPNYAIYRTNIIDILDIESVENHTPEKVIDNKIPVSGDIDAYELKTDEWKVGMRITHVNFERNNLPFTSYAGCETYPRGLCFYKTYEGAFCGKIFHDIPPNGHFIDKRYFPNGRIECVCEYNDGESCKESWWDKDGNFMYLKVPYSDIEIM